LKYDQDGNLLWQKSWGGNDYDIFTDILLIEDDGFAVAGYSYSTDIEGITNNGNSDVIIVKYDKDGNLLWQKNWGGNSENDFNKIFLTEDGGFITVGSIGFGGDIEGISIEGNRDGLIVKYDKDGNALWYINWGGAEDDRLSNLLLTQDGDIVAIGNFRTNYQTPTSFTQGVKLVPLNNSMIVTNMELPYKEGTSAVIVKYSFKYDLENTFTENGTSTIEQQGKYGIITPTPNEGYEVDKIIIKDKDDNILDVEVNKHEDGTYSFELYTDVSIEVLFKKELVNPKTGVSNIVGIMFTMILLFTSGLFVIKNYNQRYEI
jgi:hypothetical protein